MLTIGDIARGVGTDKMLNRAPPPDGQRWAKLRFRECSVREELAIHGDVRLENSLVRGVGAGSAVAEVEERAGATTARISRPEACTLSIEGGQRSCPTTDAERFTTRLAAFLTTDTGINHAGTWETTAGEGVDGKGSEHVDGKLTREDGTVIRLQLCNVSGALAASIGRHGAASEIPITPESIQAAINHKEDVDPEEKRCMDLVLHCPADVGPPFRDKLRRTWFDPKGWRRVWLCAGDEDPIELAVRE